MGIGGWAVWYKGCPVRILAQSHLPLAPTTDQACDMEGKALFTLLLAASAMASPLSRMRRQSANEVATRIVAVSKSKPELLSTAVSKADPGLLRVALTDADPKLLEVLLPHIHLHLN